MNATADPAPPPQPVDDRTRRLAGRDQALGGRAHGGRVGVEEFFVVRIGVRRQRPRPDRLGDHARTYASPDAGAAADRDGPLVGAADG